MSLNLQMIPFPVPPLQLFSLAGTFQSETLYLHTPRETWRENKESEESKGSKQNERKKQLSRQVEIEKGFSVMLKGICH